MYCTIGNGSDINGRASASQSSELEYRLPHGDQFTVDNATVVNGYVLGHPTNYPSKGQAYVLAEHLDNTKPSCLHNSQKNCFGTNALQFGCFGRYVKNLQLALKTLGYFSATIDGDFGTLTKNAVIGYQSANGLARDGIAGTNTLTKLWGGAQSTLISSGY